MKKGGAEGVDGAGLVIGSTVPRSRRNHTENRVAIGELVGRDDAMSVVVRAGLGVEQACVVAAPGHCETDGPGAVWCQQKAEDVFSFCGHRSGKCGFVTDWMVARLDCQFNIAFRLRLCEPGCLMCHGPLSNGALDHGLFLCRYHH